MARPVPGIRAGKCRLEHRRRLGERGHADPLLHSEILANIALRQGAQTDFQWVIMDAFNYYADRERGVAWQVPQGTLPQARFLLMSATLGDTAFFEEELTKRNGAMQCSAD